MAKAKKATTKGTSSKTTNGDAGNGKAKAKRQKLPPGQRAEGQVRRQLARLSTLFERVEKWPADDQGILNDARNALGQGITALQEAADQFADLPETYRPRARGMGRIPVEPGTVVRISDKRKEDYDGIVDEDDMEGLTVVAVRGNRLMVEAQSGMKMLIARGHLTLESRAAASA